MKKQFFKKISALFLAGSCILTTGAVLVSCDDTETGKPSELYAIALDKSNETIAKGSALIISPVFEDSGAAKLSYRWVSTNTDVATVVKNSDNTATVTGVGQGSTIVRIVCESDPSLYASCNVSVYPYTVALDKTSASFIKGHSTTLTPTFGGDGVENLTFAWTTSDPAVAAFTVGTNNAATVTGIEAGEAILTITCNEDDSVFATCTITVEPFTVTLDKTSETIAKTKTLVITPTFNDPAAAALPYTWTSSDESVATVAKGTGNTATVTGTGAGSATITITCDDDPSLTASCEVEVFTYTVSLNITTATIAKTEELTLTPTFNDAGANDLTYAWTSSNGSVASVVKNAGDNGATVTGLAQGTTTITITCTTDASITASCEVEVLTYAIAIDRGDIKILPGQTLAVTPTITGEGSESETYSWTSSNPSAATVAKGANNAGTVTGVAAGTATITIACDNYPAINASFEVTVVADVELSFEAGELFIGGSAAAGKTLVSATLENASQYAWLGNLSAGELVLSVEKDGNISYIRAADGDATAIEDGQNESAVMKEAFFAWNIATAGEYRIIVNFAEKTVRIHSPATKLEPFIATWFTNGTPIEQRDTPVVDLWMYGGGNGWPGSSSSWWNGFVPSLADPQVLVYSNKAKPLTSGDGVKFAVYGESDFRNVAYVFTNPLTEANLRQSITPVQAEYKLWGGYDGETRNCYYKLPAGTNFIVIDIRNMKIQCETR